MYDVNQIREDFPILHREVYKKPLIYLDNGATTQKPRCVVDAMTEEYYNVNANVHRGVHFLSQQATELHEQSRETVRRFINAPRTHEILFTRGTTESINLVAHCFGEWLASQQQGHTWSQPQANRQLLSQARQDLKADNPQQNQARQNLKADGQLLNQARQQSEADAQSQVCEAPFEVIVTTMEHHSNIVPWQMMCQRHGGRLRVVPITDEGEVIMEAYKQLFNEHTRFVSLAHVSNVMGTVNPVKEMIQIAHQHGVPVLVDGAQSTPHFAVDVQDLDCDFFAFSGHKTYGPTGVGVLYGKEEWLDRLPPYMGGGEMIKNVTFERTTYNELPFKFEAGTPDYIATTGLAKALDYLNALGMGQIEAHERALTQYALEQLQQIPHIRFIGQAPLASHDAVISFLVGDIHPLDMGTLLDRLGIAVRTGHHCAEPLMHRMQVQGTVRASFGLYNTPAEVDALVAGIERVRQMF